MEFEVVKPFFMSCIEMVKIPIVDTDFIFKKGLTILTHFLLKEETRKSIDRMPKIMRAIIEAEGFKTPF